MTFRRSVPPAVLAALVLVSGTGRSSTRRAAQPGLGESLAGLTRDEQALFRAGLEAFAEEEGLADGLGPIFNDLGCAACHSSPTVGGASTTNETRAARVRGRRYGIVQGEARGNEFRTAPLWGLSASAPYLHDGRAATVTEAIQWHRNQGADSTRAFEALPAPAREALLAFLGSI